MLSKEVRKKIREGKRGEAEGMEGMGARKSGEVRWREGALRMLSWGREDEKGIC